MASIRLLEFSGDGTRLYQSIDEFPDGHLENVLWYRDGHWRLTDRSGEEPDPDWLANFERALSPEAMVFFYRGDFLDHLLRAGEYERARIQMEKCEDVLPDQRFELDGADQARRFLLSHGITEDDATDVWTAIALHT